ncbi:DUF4153 domain-containing protein [Ulvibacterium marinum]|uniref:DUF4153 domain-containing protein n=1 Tax=Ulvibacterium marinum TaxID=2419782 RepID=UPI002494AB94|nr:DUF4153 domain-containing protein [Ulvibacterium marinum]
MKFPSLIDITGKAQNAFKRFPITLVWVILGSFFYIFLLEENSSVLLKKYSGVLLTLLLGVSWFIGTQFFVEQLKNPKKWIGLKLIVLALLSLFYWHLPDLSVTDVDPTYYIRFFLYFIAGHLFVLFAPFAVKWNKEAYWNYLKSVAYAIIRSAFFSGVLYLGLVLALLAIDALFNIDIKGERYGQLFVFCLGIVNTWIYLSDFPKEILENKTIAFNKALEVFVKYILIPLVLLYILILYAYGFKILMQWELPEGWVSYLVTALALLGFLVQIIVNPVQKSIKSWVISHFYPWFYILLLPLILLLFIAIFRRIGDYGFTENRYFVMVSAFWILGIAIYLLLYKSKRLKILPISLFILAILASFGFWGAFSISKNSQVRQFQNVYEALGSKNNKASFKEYEQLKSILSYLNDRKALSRLDAITAVDISIQGILRDTLNGTLKTYDWLDTEKILDSLGITLNPEDLKHEGAYGNYYNYYGQENTDQSLDITDYTFFTPLEIHASTSDSIPLGSYFIKYSSKPPVLTLYRAEDGKTFLELPLEPKLRKLTQYGKNLHSIDPKKLIMEFKNDSASAKLLFTSLGFYVKKDSIEISHSNIYLFLKQP